MSKISDDARAMKAYIEQHEWITHQMDDCYGNVCLVGSWGHTVGTMDYLKWREAPVMSAILDYTGYDHVPHYNDAKGRTKEEVLSMLEDVAIKHDDDEMRIKP